MDNRGDEDGADMARDGYLHETWSEELVWRLRRRFSVCLLSSIVGSQIAVDCIMSLLWSRLWLELYFLGETLKEKLLRGADEEGGGISVVGDDVREQLGGRGWREDEAARGHKISGPEVEGLIDGLLQ